MGKHLMGKHLMGKHLMGKHLMGKHLMGKHLMGKRPTFGPLSFICSLRAVFGAKKRRSNAREIIGRPPV
jgi:hypothetical protein